MIMPDSAQIVGLCSTCNNSPTCFFHRRRGPALFCELFDDYVNQSVTTRKMPAQQTAPPVGARAASEDTSRYAGLCMNCEHRHTCTHPRPAGGIWHCEEYE